MTALRVICVHGISNQILEPKYSQDLCDQLVEELKDLKVIPRNATQEEIDKVITFDEANYSKYGDQVENRYLEAYRIESEKYERPNLLDKVLDPLLDKLALSEIRKLVITSVADGLIYQGSCTDAIRNTVLECIDKGIANGDSVSVVGHSLGAVVAFDTIYYNTFNNPEWTSRNFFPANLFTLGSPVALFSLQLENCDPAHEVQKDKHDPKKTKDFQLVDEHGVWYNFLDVQDLIAYPVELYFKQKYKEVRDILVDTGTFDLLKAHTAYWENKVVARRIAERLKIDYDRLNSQ